MILQDTFEIEASMFKKNFSFLKDKNIVLYGIGRKTASLLSLVKEYNIIGLMDKDAENIGKKMYDLPVISLEKAEQDADAIIINAPETYWQIIYKRIMNTTIPVYFLDGKNAYLNEVTYVDENDMYWGSSMEDLLDKVNSNDIISFDLFETLIMRKVLRAQDIFDIVAAKVNEQYRINFVELRNSALTALPANSNIQSIYNKMQEISGLDMNELNEIKLIEIEVEKKFLIPRKDLIQLAKMIQQSKEVYIITDMYLTHEILIDILKGYGLSITEDHMLVSCELMKSKEDGGIWEFYNKNIVKDRKALHIGDNLETDIKKSMEYGISAYYIRNAYDMLLNSSLRGLIEVVTDYKASVLVGTILCDIFNNPFSLNKNKGKIIFSSLKDWGKNLWGMVVHIFLEWLITEAANDSIDELVFFSRDGYLLIDEYRYLKELTQDESIPTCQYLYISRQVMNMMAADDDLSLLKFPYNGEFQNMLADRFGIKIANTDCHINKLIELPKDFDKVASWLQPYKSNMECRIKRLQKNYTSYLEKIDWTKRVAVVDIGYWGNTQKKLSTILNKKLIGYYFYNNLSDSNVCIINNTLKPCFQNFEDKEAKKTNLFRQPQLMESIFTAPYGMVLGVDENGNPEFADKKSNQKFWMQREEINSGIKEYMQNNMIIREIISPKEMHQMAIITDQIFGIISSNTELSAELKEFFFWDDAIVQRREMQIFS